MSKITVNCAYCRGTGNDSFDLLSKHDVCPVCGGRGKIEVLKPAIPCAFCKAAGVYPHTRITCTVCLGKGVVTVVGSTVPCSKCKGTGKETESGLPCLKCGGKGVLARKE